MKEENQVWGLEVGHSLTHRMLTRHPPEEALSRTLWSASLPGPS